MSLLRDVALFALVGVVFCACPHEEDIPTEELQFSLSEEDAKTQQAIRAILDETRDACPRGLVGGEGNCVPIEVTFTKKEGKPHSVRQRVLVIDHGMWLETYLTMASRVLDLLEPDQSGTLHTTTRKQTFSKGALRIFHDEIGAKNPRMSRRVLKDLSAEINDKFVSPSRGIIGDDHGWAILVTIDELNPDAEFVVGLSGWLPKTINDGLCKNTEASYAELTSYYDNQISSYKRVVAENNIRFINLSAGESIGNTNLQCEEELPAEQQRHIMAIAFEHFYKPLGSIPGVILVQAGVNNAPKTLAPNDADFPIDCQKIPNRVRVGEVNWSRYDRSKEIFPEHRRAAQCLDVFINKGPKLSALRDPRALERAFKRNEIYCACTMDVAPCQYGTSYAAPLFLSYLIYLQETYPELDTTDKLIQKATEGGPLAVKDPGARREFLRFSSNFLQPLSEHK